MKVIVDVMGGDNAPKDILKGVFIAAKKIDDDFILVGNKEMIMHYIEKENIDLDRFDIVPSYSVIAMDDDPITSIHHKKDSSMVIALHLLKQGEGDVVVGAGNTGAFFSAASLIVKRREGIKRAAIGTLLPGLSPCLLLDAGANISVTDQYMEQFAQIGSEYMREMFNIKYPTVGLLNNGTEEGKGTALQIETAKRLRKNEEIRFVGNVEASSVLKGVCDVVVCDGFTGNIFLKATEGMGSFIFKEMKGVYSQNLITKFSYYFVRKQISTLKKKLDASEHGGSPFLGLSKPVIKAHGSSNAKAFSNAVLQAVLYAKKQEGSN